MKFHFAEFKLDTERRELSSLSELVATTPKVLDLLIFLIENRDRVVGKEGLLATVWGGRIVSDSTVASHLNAARKAVGDTGGEQRLIRTVSRKGFRFIGDVQEEDDPVELNGASAPNSLVPVDRPSIAVLRFQNLSGDPREDYFADGVVEDIISALSRIDGLFVIARNSSFTYDGPSVDIRQVGRELGVRYVLEGSIRRSDSRVRITGKLIDAAMGTSIWSERLERSSGDIFELQDEVAAGVVGAISPQLERAEIERALRKPTSKLDAYDHYLQGLAAFHLGTREAITEALQHFYSAIDIDPDYGAALGSAAWCLFWRKINGWQVDVGAEHVEGARLAERAIIVGKDDAIALARAGHALGHFGGDLARCISFVDRALVLNPNLAAAWYLGGFQRITRGDPDEAIEYFARAMRLSPLDPEMLRMQVGTALSHLLAGRFETAASWAEKAFQTLPSFLLAVGVIASSYGHMGRIKDGEMLVQHLRSLNPKLRISTLKNWVMLAPDGLELFAAGLRNAGLPE